MPCLWTGAILPRSCRAASLASSGHVSVQDVSACSDSPSRLSRAWRPSGQRALGRAQGAFHLVDGAVDHRRFDRVRHADRSTSHHAHYLGRSLGRHGEGTSSAAVWTSTRSVRDTQTTHGKPGRAVFLKPSGFSGASHRPWFQVPPRRHLDGASSFMKNASRWKKAFPRERRGFPRLSSFILYLSYSAAFLLHLLLSKMHALFSLPRQQPTPLRHL